MEIIEQIQGFSPIFLKTKKYEYNITTVRDFGGHLKLVTHNCIRNKGCLDITLASPKGSVNDEKLDCNISRAKSRIFELALCNKWSIFLTFTLDPKKYDRNDLNTFSKDVGQFIRNYNRLHQTDIKYLLIPEEHAKGGWHMHGFLLGLPLEHLRLFSLKEKLPKYIKDKIKNGQSVFEWEAYRRKFGFCDLEQIRNEKACSAYVTKYITKDLTRTVTASGAHLYYCSKGLKRSVEVFRGKANDNIVYDYMGEYNSVKWLPDGTSKSDLTKYVHDYITIEKLKKQARTEHNKHLYDFKNYYNTRTGEIYQTPFDDTV